MKYIREAKCNFGTKYNIHLDEIKVKEILITRVVKEYKGKSTSLSVIRNGEPVELMATVSKDGTLGFISDRSAYLNTLVEHKDYTIGESVAMGITKPFDAIVTFKSATLPPL